MQLIFLDPLTIPACLSVGRAGFSQWRPCLLWKHWDLPSLGIHNTKVVYLRHMDSNSTNASCCAIQVKFAPTSGPMTSSFCHLHEKVSQTMGRVLESLSGHQKAWSETYTRKDPMSSGRSGTTLSSSRIHLQALVCWGYQRQCLDTGKLGVVSWFEAR